MKERRAEKKSTQQWGKGFLGVDTHEALLSKWGTGVEIVQNVNGDMYCSTPSMTSQYTCLSDFTIISSCRKLFYAEGEIACPQITSLSHIASCLQMRQNLQIFNVLTTWDIWWTILNSCSYARCFLTFDKCTC